MKVIVVLLAALMLGACASPGPVPTKTEIMVIAPPANLYKCPPSPTKPDATKVITEKQVARYITSLYAARGKCDESLKAIKSYVDQTTKQVQP
jgi:hypothetical protein